MRRTFVALITLIITFALTAPQSGQAADTAPEGASPARAPGFFTPTADGGAILAVNTRGTAEAESADPPRATVTFPIFSLVTGEEIGTMTADFAPASTPTVFDVTNTFRFPDGRIVNRMLISTAQFPDKPGWILTGARPEGDTIVETTGAYSGRTGRVRQSGADDMAQFPTITQDHFWVIELNP